MDFHKAQVDKFKRAQDVQIPSLEQLKQEEYNFFAIIANDKSDPPLPIVPARTTDPRSPDYLSPRLLKSAQGSTFFNEFKASHA